MNLSCAVMYLDADAGLLCGGVALPSVQLWGGFLKWRNFAKTICSFSRIVPLPHTSIICPGTSLRVTSFTRPTASDKR